MASAARPAAVHRLEIPAQPPTLNALMRGKLRDRMRLSRQWRDMVTILARYRDGIPPAACKRRVTLTIVLGPRQRGADPDAYQTATADALKSAGLLRDDSRRWVEWAPLRYERGEAPACVIELEDI